jgi:hypothetical protein
MESKLASFEKGGKSDVENWQLQYCSPHLCQLRINEFVPQVNIKRTDCILELWIQ